MKESYVEGLPIHNGPESCGAVRKGGAEPWTGERAGRVLSCERILLRAADAVGESGRPHPAYRYRKVHRSPARSEAPCTRGSISHGNREAPGSPGRAVDLGRVGKSKDTRR
jgi:hypothetical protein